jgi:hypothetical protein
MGFLIVAVLAAGFYGWDWDDCIGVWNHRKARRENDRVRRVILAACAGKGCGYDRG